ncbi:hypothetical protein [Kordiimonas sp.]|uniref:hypothetical protein n=1 Tax=Kordiimonas sp. TaxID=1970157 RepID=UPI003A929CBD
MKFFLPVFHAAVGTLMRAAAMPFSSLKAAVGRFFYAHPTFKRAGLVFALQLVVLVPLGIFATVGGDALFALMLTCFMAMWCAFLTGLFLGLGAERASSDWDSIFALPPLQAFVFWRWHAIERKRFYGVLGAIFMGLLCAARFGWPV